MVCSSLLAADDNAEVRHGCVGEICRRLLCILLLVLPCCTNNATDEEDSLARYAEKIDGWSDRASATSSRRKRIAHGEIIIVLMMGVQKKLWKR
mmetsp:Transcript_36105/g.73596  ORF Transcript_36105/g.73596 Transcript_36105/m.73596 type:complete len:94 (+) Transcript_36105:1335-1616(+)